METVEAFRKNTPEGQTLMINPLTGKVVEISEADKQDALTQNYTTPSNEDIQKHIDIRERGGPAQTALAAVEPAVDLLTGGKLGETYKQLTNLGVPGITPTDVETRARVNPIAHPLGGLFSAVLLPGGGLPSAIGESAFAKIGSTAAKMAVETSLMQANSEVSKMALDGEVPSNEAIQTAMLHTGLAGMFGAALGGGLQGANQLWEASGVGQKFGNLLKNVSSQLGNSDESTATNMHILNAELNPEPAVKAGLLGDSNAKNQFQILAAGRGSQSIELLDSIQALRNEGNTRGQEILGKTEQDVNNLKNLSTLNEGEKIENGLKEGLERRMAPLKQEFETLKDKYSYADIPNEPSAIEPPAIPVEPEPVDMSNPKNWGSGEINEPPPIPDELNPPRLPNEILHDTIPLVPGASTKESLIAEVENLLNENENGVPKSKAELSEINQTLEDLPNIKNARGLAEYQTKIYDRTYKAGKGDLHRIADNLIRVLRDAEENIVKNTMEGEPGGRELVARYEAVRAKYHEEMNLYKTLNQRLRVGKIRGPQGFINSIEDINPSEIAKKLTNPKDAELVRDILPNFPEAENAIKEYHLDKLVKKSTGLDGKFSVLEFNKNFSKLEPEIRDLILTREEQSKLSSIDSVLRAIPKPGNPSGTGGMVQGFAKQGLRTALGYIGALSSHNPMVGFLIGNAAGALGTEAPDAIRLAWLKFLGSQEAPNALGFKVAVNTINNMTKGQALLNKAISNVFKPGAEILTLQMDERKRNREKLEKALEKFKDDPSKMLNIDEQTSSYLPGHSQAVGEMTAKAVNYLNQLKPNIMPQGIFDKEHKPSKAEQANYERSLDIANQPLITLKELQKGTLLPNDVHIVRNLYPELFNKISQKLVNQIIESKSKGTEIPYGIRLNASLFLGTPLDRTMTPQSIQQLQNFTHPAIGMTKQGQPKQMRASGGRGLERMTNMNLTPLQSRDMARTK